MSYLTKEELDAAQALHKRAPYAICGVSNGIFSIARRSRGATFQGCAYTYIPVHDELVRDDVLRLVTKMRKTNAAPKAAPQDAQQLDWGPL